MIIRWSLGPAPGLQLMQIWSGKGIAQEGAPSDSSRLHWMPSLFLAYPHLSFHCALILPYLPCYTLLPSLPKSPGLLFTVDAHEVLPTICGSGSATHGYLILSTGENGSAIKREAVGVMGDKVRGFTLRPPAIWLQHWKATVLPANLTTNYPIKGFTTSVVLLGVSDGQEIDMKTEELGRNVHRPLFFCIICRKLQRKKCLNKSRGYLRRSLSGQRDQCSQVNPAGVNSRNIR